MRRKSNVDHRADQPPYARPAAAFRLMPAVRRHQRHVLQLRLGDEDPIERIGVVLRQGCDVQGVRMESITNVTRRGDRGWPRSVSAAPPA
jgi:hypothetical protein